MLMLSHSEMGKIYTGWCESNEQIFFVNNEQKVATASEMEFECI